jgi:hypothetical protein
MRLARLDSFGLGGARLAAQVAGASPILLIHVGILGPMLRLQQLNRADKPVNLELPVNEIFSSPFSHAFLTLHC